jgi:hypothetical protein
VLYNALIAIAGFLLGLRAGLAMGYRAERGRRIVGERAWLRQLARVIGVRPPEGESIDAARERLLEATRDRLDEPPRLVEGLEGPRET